jgi:hypothetical protein
LGFSAISKGKDKVLGKYPQGDSNPLTISADSKRNDKPEKAVTETPPQASSIPLAHSLARETQIDPDLARLIDAWPNLPEALRTGIVAMIDSARMDG